MKYGTLGLLTTLGVLVVGMGISAFWPSRDKLSLFGEQKPAIAMEHIADCHNIMPVVVVGSGPAALSAAVYSARSRLDTLVIQGSKPGGALTETSYVENWPGRSKTLGTDLITDLLHQAKTFGAHFLADTVSSLDFNTWPYTIHTQNNHTIRALTVIIASGSTPRQLGIAGEQEYWGKGVTTCAICDAPFHNDHEVAVVGGGDSAVEEALQLAPYAKNITIFVRKEEMRAAASMQERLQDYSTINVVYNTEIQKIVGDGQHVTGIECYNNATNTVTTMPVQGVFLAIGHEPNTTLYNGLPVDESGYISVKGRSQQTAIPGVFAAGDVQDSTYKQAGVAAGDGIKAALDAVAFLQKHGYTTKRAQQIAHNLFDYQQHQTLTLNVVSTKEELENVVQQEVPVIVDFYADYCPSCMRMLPDLERVAYQLDNQARFYKVDCDASKELAKEYHVQSLPTLLIFDQGQLVGRYNEVMNQHQLKEFVMRFVKKPVA